MTLPGRPHVELDTLKALTEDLPSRVKIEATDGLYRLIYDDDPECAALFCSGLVPEEADALATLINSVPAILARLTVLEALYWSVGEVHDPMKLNPYLTVVREEFYAARRVMVGR